MCKRLFALEFIKHSLNVDQVHFVQAKKGNFFKLRNIIRPFIVKKKQAIEEVENILKIIDL